MTDDCSTRLTAQARRERARQVRDAFPPMGIYAIRNHATGSARVGASRNVHATLNRIQCELRWRTHTDKALQAEWDHDGPSMLAFEALQLLKQRDDPAFDYAAELRELEALWRHELDVPSSQAGA